MNSPKFVLAIFVLALPFFLTAQQAQRSKAPEEILDMHRGELVKFDTYLLRFEAAYEENELQSMEDIRLELLKIMEAEVAQLEQKPVAGKATPNRLDQQKSLLKQFKGEKLNAGRSKSENADDPAFLRQLNRFREQMQLEINDLEAQLKSNRHE